MTERRIVRREEKEGRREKGEGRGDQDIRHLSVAFLWVQELVHSMVKSKAIRRMSQRCSRRKQREREVVKTGRGIGTYSPRVSILSVSEAIRSHSC